MVSLRGGKPTHDVVGRDRLAAERHGAEADTGHEYAGPAELLILHENVILMVFV
jgi:hypothetical protein